MELLTVILTFLGGGVLTGLLTFLTQKKQEKRADYQAFVGDIYREIGRLTQEVQELRKEREELFDELILQRERNAEIKAQYEALKKDYEELIVINKELKEKIDRLLEEKGA